MYAAATKDEATPQTGLFQQPAEEMMKPGLYIHVPFCLSKCPYCTFYSVTDTRRKAQYLKAAAREMSLYQDLFPAVDTIYVGGGTPSLLSSGEMEVLLDAARRTFAVDPDAEISVEVNPADIDIAWLSSLFDLGVNRLTIGVQAFDDDVLGFLGRRHDARQAIAAIDDARAAGFENIGIDLIYAVPGQDLAGWGKTLDTACSFDLPHLSCYELHVATDTPLGGRYRAGLFRLPDEDRQYAFFMETTERLDRSGYRQYEVSNFCRGDEGRSRHNRKYWNHTPYLGIGPAAHSLVVPRRWWNAASVSRYVEDLSSGKRPVAGDENLDAGQLAQEALFLGFRTADGIDLEDFRACYGRDLLAEKAAEIGQLEKAGYLQRSGGRLRPTRRGLAVADRLALL